MFPINRGICFSLEANPNGWTKIIFLHSYRTGILELAATLPARQAVMGQEFVVGGYFPGPDGFDSLIVGYYEGKNLMYVARTRNGFVPASRREGLSESLTTKTTTTSGLPLMRSKKWTATNNSTVSLAERCSSS
jgi:hypothetical protein